MQRLSRITAAARGVPRELKTVAMVDCRADVMCCERDNRSG